MERKEKIKKKRQRKNKQPYESWIYVNAKLELVDTIV